ncbi:MAG: DUF1653 domain-containing protein [Mesorhizobium sp.]|uniref:hypothetical protein n=1 Tax=Mesorhizobium sp. TaxID=1871066 RepID=UPI0012187FE3|nr:hypothetical protein [Mesorhizobium sp.]TJV51100.1 MAG: DUF1653 domain-containing protein [Mesorhizobium sp.]
MTDGAICISCGQTFSLSGPPHFCQGLEAAMEAVIRIRKWIDAQQYENDVLSVGQLRELLTGQPWPCSQEASPRAPSDEAGAAEPVAWRPKPFDMTPIPETVTIVDQSQAVETWKTRADRLADMHRDMCVVAGETEARATASEAEASDLRGKLEEARAGLEEARFEAQHNAELWGAAEKELVQIREQCPLCRRQDYFEVRTVDLVKAQVSEMFSWQSRAETAERKLEEARKAPSWQPTHQHLKRRSLYRFVGAATLQTSIPLSDTDAMVVYQAEDGSLWVRPHTEFFDGRFLTLAGEAG